MAKIENFLWPSSSQRGEDSGKKKVFLILTFFDRVASKIVSLPSILPRNMALLPHFLVPLALTLDNFGQEDGNGKNFAAIIKPVK